MTHTILVAEDDPLQRTMIGMMLEKRLGYEVIAVENGKKAFEIVQSSDIDAIQAVMLDLAMPVMNGLDALQHIRRSRPDLPVIMLTAEMDTAVAVKAIKEGAFDFITKPPNGDH